jgi:predicted translin family RNA/ssDNA-binding protein
MQANEEWRNDPRRRSLAGHLCKKRARLYLMMIEDLERAQRCLRMIQETGEELPTALNGYRAMNFASDIEDARRKYNHYNNATSTLIGNMAAFGEGA